MKPEHTLTHHARIRLAERTAMTEAEFLALADAASVVVYLAEGQIRYEILWSGKDRMGFVLVVQGATGEIVTVMPVLTETGYPCKVQDSHKTPDAGHDVGASKVTSAMLEQAVLAVGADISEAKAVLDVLKGFETKPRAWNYRWVVRFLCSKEGGGTTTKTKTVGKEIEIPAGPPADVLADARAAISEFSGWDAGVYLMARDTMEEFGAWDMAGQAMSRLRS